MTNGKNFLSFSEIRLSSLMGVSMETNYYIQQLICMDSALATAYVLGKLAADPSKVSIDDLSRIDVSLIEEHRDEQ
jgi:hypothetical protein